MPELTIGDIYDGIHERLALARTHWLMGNQDKALDLLYSARDDYETFKPALQDYLPIHALDHAFQVTMATCTQKEPELCPSST